MSNEKLNKEKYKDDKSNIKSEVTSKNYNDTNSEQLFNLGIQPSRIQSSIQFQDQDSKDKTMKSKDKERDIEDSSFDTPPIMLNHKKEEDLMNIETYNDQGTLPSVLTPQNQNQNKKQGQSAYQKMYSGNNKIAEDSLEYNDDSVYNRKPSHYGEEANLIPSTFAKYKNSEGDRLSTKNKDKEYNKFNTKANVELTNQPSENTMYTVQNNNLNNNQDKKDKIYKTIRNSNKPSDSSVTNAVTRPNLTNPNNNNNTENKTDDDNEKSHLSQKSTSTVDEYSYKSTIFKIFKIGGSIIFAQLLGLIRYTLLYVFSRQYGLAVLTAVSTVTSLFSIITFGISWAFSQGYGFKASEYAGAQEYSKLGRLTNKAMFINIVIGTVLAILLAFCSKSIFSAFITDAETLSNIQSIFSSISLCTPLQFIQMVQLRYFLAIGYTSPLIIAAICGTIGELIALFIIVQLIGSVSFGLGLSFAIGQGVLVGYNAYVFFFNNPSPASRLPWDIKDITNGMWNFVKYTIPLFTLIFLTYISYDLVPFLAFTISESAFATYGLIFTMLSFAIIFAEAIAAANNVLLNKAIGQKIEGYFFKIIYSTGIIILIYLLITIPIFIGTYHHLVGFFTTVEKAKTEAYSLKFWFIIAQTLLCFHPFISESITALGDEYFPIYTLIAGRFIFSVGLTLLMTKVWSLGVSSILISFSIGQLVILLVNSYRLYSLVSEITQTFHLNLITTTYDNNKKEKEGQIVSANFKDGDNENNNDLNDKEINTKEVEMKLQKNNFENNSKKTK